MTNSNRLNLQIDKSSEFSKIQSIQRIVGSPSSRVLVGIGDDAAVIRSSSRQMLFCSDALVENVHFDLSWISPEDLGHKAVASCLSDLAAMNGDPVAILISLALPSRLRSDFIDQFYLGAQALAKRVGADIVGGDLSGSKSDLFIDVSCFGESDRALLRSGAKAGDVLAVSGHPGASAAGLFALQNRSRFETDLPVSLIHAHVRPEPRFDLLPALRVTPGLCTALIDMSDGLSSEILHLATRSSVSFEIEASAIPLHPDSLRLARLATQSQVPTGLSDSFLSDVKGTDAQLSSDHSTALAWALSGGEDYQLLATFDASAIAQFGLPNGFTLIGRATSCAENSRSISTLKLIDGSVIPLKATGFDHFSEPTNTSSR